MKVEYDFTGFDLLARALGQTETFETAIMTATQNIARVLHDEVLKRTPVETGNLRKMWSAGNNLLFDVKKEADGYTVTLINTAQDSMGYKYGWVVNYGHHTPNGGWVMGRFFVENSIAATEDQSKPIIQKELQKWFKRCLNGK